MKRFIVNSSLFIIFSILFLGILFILLNTYLCYSFNKFELYKSKSIIFIGDSHIEQAIIDTIIPNSINIGQNSESFVFSYYKLKYILSKPNSVKDVYLGFSYHNISSYYDEFIFGKYSNSISSRYFYILPINERIKLLLMNRNPILLNLKAQFKVGLMNLIFNENSVFGGYINNFDSTQANIESMDKRIRFQFYSNDKINEFSKINLEYLDRIIRLCKGSNIRLFLLNTPLQSYYRNSIPSSFILKYNYIINANKLELIDLSSLELGDSCYIPDGDHVSTKGALLISQKLNDLILKQINN